MKLKKSLALLLTLPLLIINMNSSYATTKKVVKLSGVKITQNSSSVKISWVKGEVTNYKLEKEDTAQSLYVTEREGKVVKVKLINLDELDLSAKYRVTIYNKKNLLLDKTLTLDSAPSLPNDLKISTINNKISILWGLDPNTQPSNARYLEVAYSEGLGKVKKEKVDMVTHIYSIDKIDRKLSHKITITPVNNYGRGESRVENIASFVPSEVSNVKGTFTSPDKINLSWDYEGNRLDSINIKVLSPKNKRDGEVIPLAGYSKSTEITGLTTGVIYKFLISTVNKDGVSAGVNTPEIVTAKAPGKVADFKVVAGSSSATINWVAPTDNGGAIVTSYILSYKAHDATTFTEVSLPVTPLTKSITNLINGTTYDFMISAVNLVGRGEESLTLNSTPGVAPASPTSLTATSADKSVTLSWIAPAAIANLPLTNYQLTISPAPVSTNGSVTIAANLLTYTVNNLTNGTAYTFKLTATNNFGSSATPASATATPIGTPGAPTGLTTQASNGKIVLTWSAPTDNGGTAISGYEVKYKKSSEADSAYIPVTANATSTLTTASISSLTNGLSYTFSVATLTNAGKIKSITAPPVNDIPYTTPNPPTSLSTTPQLNAVKLSWLAPTSDNGRAVSKYKVEYRLATATTWVTASDTVTDLNFTVTGLAAGSNYNFQVSAYNLAGFSLPTAIVNAIPVNIPNGPATLTALPDTVNGGGKMVLNWTEGSSNGGSVITGYKVEYKLSSSSNFITANASNPTLTYTFSNLDAGNSYDFQVSAINAAGTSLPRSVTATPLGAPSAPTGLSLVVSSASITVNYSAPSNNGGSAITSYLIEYKSANDSTFTTIDNALSLSKVINSLTNGLNYTVNVYAINKFGTSIPQSSTTLVASVPDAPTFTGNTPTSNSFEVNWSLPINTGGLPLSLITFKYKEHNAIDYTNLTLAPTDTKISVINLNPSTQYDISINCSTNYGSSNFINGSVTTTA